MFNVKFHKESGKPDPGIPLINDPSIPLILNLEQRRLNEQNKKSEEEHRKRRKQTVKKQKAVRAAYSIFDGDPKALLTRTPEALSSNISFYHRSLPQFRNEKDEHGRLIVHEVKKWLSNPNNGYKATTIPVESYAHRPEWVKLAPRGLQVFVKTPEGSPTKTRASKAIIDLHRLNASKRVTPLLRQTTNGLGVDPLDPNHPINVLKSEGLGAALRTIFTDDHQYASSADLPTSIALKKCVCGAHEDKHVTEEEAIEHNAKNPGEHLEIHKFTPEFVLSSDGKTLEKGAPFRAGNSFLRYSISPDDPSKPVEKTKMISKRADSGYGFDGMPVVNIGLYPNRIIRKRLEATGLDKFGEKIKDVIFPKTKTYQDITCPGIPGVQPCYGGFTKPSVRNNKIPCRNCTPGLTTFDGETGEEISIGLGNGKVRLQRKEDCPNCSTCNGDGFKLTADKANQKKVECRTCKGSGKDLSALSSGIACNSCNSDNSIVSVSSSNKCPVCDGTAIAPFPKLKTTTRGKQQVEVIQPINDIFEGNLIELIPFDSSGHANTGVDGWKGHGNKNCTRCHGDDEYQTAERMPCNCRIGNFEDRTSLIAPKGVKFISHDGIKLPEILLQVAMARNFPEGEVPHTREHDFGSINPDTGVPFEDNYDGEKAIQYFKEQPGAIDQLIGTQKDKTTRPIVHHLGMYQDGVTLPPSILKELQKRSKVHRSSVNAEFCAGSAELEDIHELMSKRFLELPMTIPGVKIKTPTVKRQKDNSVDATALHPRTQQAIPALESTISKIGDPTGEISKTTQPVYEAASRLEYARDSGADPDKHWDIYDSAVNNMLSKAAETHSNNKKILQQIRKSLTGFPSVRTDSKVEIPLTNMIERTDVE